MKDVKNVQSGDSITIIENKTHKKNVLKINKMVFKSLQNYLSEINPDDDAYLFSSRKGNGSLSVPAVNYLIKTWTGNINLQGRYGAHVLRKTWGYIQRVEFGTSFEIICKRFLHSSPSVTMRYLGIQDKEVDEILLNEIG